MKKVKKIQLKVIIFTAMKNRCIFHWRVFVMLAERFLRRRSLNMEDARECIYSMLTLRVVRFKLAKLSNSLISSEKTFKVNGRVRQNYFEQLILISEPY